jgi:hypothetical protein
MLILHEVVWMQGVRVWVVDLVLADIRFFQLHVLQRTLGGQAYVLVIDGRLLLILLIILRDLFLEHFQKLLTNHEIRGDFLGRQDDPVL